MIISKKYFKTVLILASVFFLAFTSCELLEDLNPDEDESDGPEGSAKWQTKLGNGVSTPAIGNNGNIYVGVRKQPEDKSVATEYVCAIVKLSPEGEILWEYVLDPKGLRVGATKPRIAPGGTIYAVKRKKVYAINPNGTKKWIWEPPEDHRHNLTGGLVDENGNLYVRHPDSWDFNAKVFSINPNGETIWMSPGEDKGWWMNRMTIGKNGNLYMVHDMDSDPCLREVDAATGSTIWTSAYENDVYHNWTDNLPVGPDGTIYVTDDQNTRLLAIDPENGSKKWQINYDGGVGTPLVGPDGNLYFSEDGGADLKAVSADGSLLWEYDIQNGNMPDMAIDNNGTIYVADFADNNFLAINQDGSLKWKNDTIGWHGGHPSPAISPKGVIYHVHNVEQPDYGKSSMGITAINGSAPLASGCWPRSQCGNKNANRY